MQEQLFRMGCDFAGCEVQDLTLTYSEARKGGWQQGSLSNRTQVNLCPKHAVPLRLNP